MQAKRSTPNPARPAALRPATTPAGPARVAGQPRYQERLVARVRAAVRVVHAMVHDDPDTRAAAQAEADLLDVDLWRWEIRYQHDHLSVILPAEAAAWHVPTEMADALARLKENRPRAGRLDRPGLMIDPLQAPGHGLLACPYCQDTAITRGHDPHDPHNPPDNTEPGDGHGRDRNGRGTA